MSLPRQLETFMFKYLVRRAGFWLVALPLASLAIALLLMLVLPVARRSPRGRLPAPSSRGSNQSLATKTAATAPESLANAPLTVRTPLVRRIALWTGAAGLACAALVFLLLAVLPLTGRYATYAVLSGSMEPAIPVGSVAIAVPADPADLQVGDVISYTALQPGRPSLTHRIVSIRDAGDGFVFKTKGDANATDDAWDVRYTRLAGRVVGAVPLLGYLMVGATQPGVRSGLAAAVILILGALWLRAVLSGAFRPRLPKLAGHARALAASLGMISIWAGALVGPTGSTYGSFSSTTTNPSNSFTTANQLAPQNLSTTADCIGGDIVLDWTAPTGGWATSYSIYRSTTTGTELSGTLVTSGITGTSLTDTTATNVSSTTYFYKVVAFDVLGNGGSTTASTEASSSGCPSSVVSTLPAGGSTGVSAAQPNGTAAAITVDFDQSLTTSTVTASTFTISPSVTLAATPFTFNSYNSNSNAEAVMNLGTTLAASTTYTVTLTTGVKNANGVALANSYSFVFSTGTNISTTGPVVLTVSPANSATGIALNTAVTVNFSTSIDTSTVTNGSTFCLFATGGSCSSNVAGSISWSGSPSNSTLTFTPSAQLSGFVTYKVSLSSTIADTIGGTGHTLGSNYTSSFTTVSVQSTTLPTVISQYPTYAGSLALSTAPITITFSTSMSHGAVESAFCLFANSTGTASGAGSGTCASDSVAGTFSWSGNTMSFQPSAALGTTPNTSTIYALTIQGNGGTSPATDGLGNALDSSNTPLLSTSTNHLSGQTSTQFASAFSIGSNCNLSAGVSPSTAFPGGTATVVNKNPSWTQGDSLKLTWDTSTGVTLATGVMGNQCSDLAITVPITATSGSHVLFLKDVTSGNTDTAQSITVNPLSAATSVMSISSQKPGISEPRDAAIITVNVTSSGAAAVNAGVQFSVTSCATGSACPNGSWATISSTSGATDANGNASTTLIITSAPTNAAWVQVSAVVGTGGATGCPTGNCSLKLPAIPGPSVVSSLPSGTSVVPNSLVTVLFNESMTADTTSGSAAHFCLSTSSDCSTGIVAGFSGTSGGTTYTNGIAWGGNPSNTLLTFTPSANLTSNTQYFISAGTSEEAFGNINPLASAYSANFTICNGCATDTTAPTVSSISPQSGQTAIDTGTDITVTFSEAMNKPSVETAFCLFEGTGSCSSGGVTGTFSWPSSSQVVFQPFAGLQEPTIQYKVTIATTALDEAGNAINSATTCVTSACTFTTNSNTTPTSLTITASPTSLTPSTSSAVTSTITATVKTNGAAVSGKTVSFSVTTDPTSGIPASVSPTSGTTNASGVLTTTLTLAAATPAAAFDDITVTASVTLFSSPNQMTGCPAGSTCSVVINDPPPPPPSGLVATPGSIWLHWVEPSSAKIAGYKVYYGFASGQYDHEIDAGKTGALHIEDVIPGATYYLAARSYAHDGKVSDWSEEVSITLAPATPTPIPCQATATPTATATPCAGTPTSTATSTPVTSATPHTTSTPTPTLSPTPSTAPCETPIATASPTPTGSPTATGTATHTATPSPTATPCVTPSSTPTDTATPTATGTQVVLTGSPTATETASAAVTSGAAVASQTPTPTATLAATVTQTPAATATATNSPTPTSSPSPSSTPTTAPSATPTSTPTRAATNTPATTNTPAPTNTAHPPTATATH